MCSKTEGLLLYLSHPCTRCERWCLSLHVQTKRAVICVSSWRDSLQCCIDIFSVVGAFLESGNGSGNLVLSALYVHSEKQGFKITDLSQKYIDVKLLRLQEIQ